MVYIGTEQKLHQYHLLHHYPQQLLPKFDEKFGTQITISVIYVIIDSNLMFRRYKIKNKLQMFC